MGKREFTDRHKKVLAASAIALFVVLSIAVFWFVGRPLVQFLSEPERFREWVDEKGFLGRVAFVGMIVLQIFVAFIPGEPLEIGAGYAFGAVEGTLLCLIGGLIGGVVVFLFVRRFGVKAVEVFFSREKIDSLKFLQDSKRLNLLVLIILLVVMTALSVCLGAYFLTRSTGGDYAPTLFVADADGRSWDDMENIPVFMNEVFGDTVIAPGQDGTYAFTFENRNDNALVFSFTFTEANDYGIDITYRLKRDGAYIVGADGNYVGVEPLSVGAGGLTIEANSDSVNDKNLLNTRARQNVRVRYEKFDGGAWGKEEGAPCI